jgi:quinolinate synthase
VKRAGETDAEVIIIGTEEGLLDRLKREHPEKTFLPAKKYAVCGPMKRITLENLYVTMGDEEIEVNVPDEISVKAKGAIERMLDMS